MGSSRQGPSTELCELAGLCGAGPCQQCPQSQLGISACEGQDAGPGWVECWTRTGTADDGTRQYFQEAVWGMAYSWRRQCPLHVAFTLTSCAQEGSPSGSLST